MSSSDYPTINYNVFIPSNWSSSSSGFTEAQLNKKYLKFPTAQTTQPETMNNIVLTGRITTTTANPLVIDNPLSNTFISSVSTSTATGVDNTSLGFSSLPILTSGNRNTAIGNECLTTLTTGNDNTAVGHNTLFSSSGGQNTAVGCRAGENFNIPSSNNTYIGFRAGSNVGSFSTLGENTFLGALTKFNAVTDNFRKSTAIGYDATITASNQVVLGTSTESVLIPSGNIYTPASNINISSNKTLTLGSNNVAIGLAALQNADGNTNGNNAIGYGALQNSKIGNNTALGFYALPTVTTGGNNTAIGTSAGGINSGVGITTGTNNTFLGANTNIATGQEACNKSTAIGQGAIITASNQIVLGTSSETLVLPSGIIQAPRVSGNVLLSSRATFPNIGTINTSYGAGTFQNLNNAFCEGNTAVGVDSLRNINAVVEGDASNNTAIGRASGFTITTGAFNTCVGYNAGGTNITAGTRNTFIGESATSSIANPINSTAIGSGATISASNQVVLGTSLQNTVIPSGVITTLKTTGNGANTFISSRTIANNNGRENTAIGIGAFNSNVSANSNGNTAVGFDCLKAVVGTGTALEACDNTAIGKNAGLTITTGSGNTIIGSDACNSVLTTGKQNTFIGDGTSITGAGLNQSTAIGYNAQITASNQVVLGTTSETVVIPGSLRSVIKTTDVNNNILMGSTANLSLIAGSNNTIIGDGVLASLNTDVNNDFNTVIGSRSLEDLTTGASNTVVGYYSAPNMTSGGSMTVFGSGCGAGIVTGCERLTMFGSACDIDVFGASYTNSTAIGFNSQISGSNQVVLGTSSESVVIPERKVIGLAQEISAPMAVPFTITGISGTTMTTSGNPPLTRGMSIYGNLISLNTTIVSGSGNTWEVSVSQTTGATTGLYGITPSFSIANITGTTMTTTGNPPLSVGMLITGQGIVSASVASYTYIVSGSGNTWIVSISQTIGAITGYYHTTTPFNITSISGTAMTTTGSPTLATNMPIYGAGITSGTFISSGSGNSWVVNNSQTIGAITGYYVSNQIRMVSWDNGSGATGTSLITAGSPPLGVGMFVSGSGVASFSRVTAVLGPNSFTMSNSLLSGVNVLNYILPYKVSFPLPETHYVIPNTIRYDYPLYIVLPPITSQNICAKTSFRTVGTNQITGSGVFIVSLNNNVAITNMYMGVISATGTSNHQQYATNSVALLTHSLTCLPTSLNSTRSGWFQQASS